jgi:hypothetical protein
MVTTGRPMDEARASGTALAAYFLSLAGQDVSGELYDALHRQCAGSVLGFGYMREFARDGRSGRGDVDSGPVLLGTSISGTGFSLALARAAGDRAGFVALYRLAHLIGSPVSQSDQRVFVCGGPLGNAIMLAMLTAGRTPP